LNSVTNAENASPAPYEIELEIPGRSPTGNDVIRWHWTRKRKHVLMIYREIQAAMMNAHIPKPPRPLKHARIEIISVRKQLCDTDRLYGGLTAYVDALQVPTLKLKRGGRNTGKPLSKPGLAIILNDTAKCIDYIAKQRVGFPERVIIRVVELQGEP
jgi:hypothetical protein